LIKHVDHIITVDDPFKKYYENLTEKPVTTVMNCKDLVFNRYEPPKNKTFTIVYIGIMTRRRFFPKIIDIVSELNNVKLILAGKKEGIYHEMEEYAKRYSNVEFRGTIPTKDILKLTRAADALFLIVDNTNKQAKIVVFNKQFEAMVCGRPIIITKGIYAAEMTERLKCGLTVEYNKESVKEAIIKLRDDPDLCEKLGRNAFNAAKKQYNWENEKKNLLKVYEGVK
jgi:glycosyltransferase involved in cell wall biosynthesis